MQPNTVFLSCDWGTSSLRLRLVERKTLEVIGEHTSVEGIASTHAAWQNSRSKLSRLQFYQAVLYRHITQLATACKEPLDGVNLILSGMASSSIGMLELPYKAIPVSLHSESLNYTIINATDGFPHNLLLISGLQTETDVLRGEETLLLGCHPNEEKGKEIYIFPGTHSKHLIVEKQQLVNFKTYMTGDFFQALSTQTVLSKSILPNSSLDNEHKKAFIKGVAIGQHQNILHAAFSIRTNDLFHRFSKEENYWYLSGLVIGTELKELSGQQANAYVLVSEGKLLQSYQLALAEINLNSDIQSISATEALLKGQAMFLPLFRN